ncbi:MAG: cupin domain-containing protein [Solirubrobacteraceae bacterium]
MSAFEELSAMAPQRIWEGVLARAVHGERVSLAVVELDAGSVVPEHRHENEQVGVIVAGSLRFRIGDEIRVLASGGAWCIPANVPHGVEAGPEGAVAIEVFAPPRDDWGALERVEAGRSRWPAAE